MGHLADTPTIPGQAPEATGAPGAAGDATFEPPRSCVPFRFEEPLREGVILVRPNRFIMDVALDGQQVRCHCPAVSRIGGLDLAGRPCLVSDSHDPKRKMPLTVEAYSLARPEDAQRPWVGINQNASNRYVEHFLRQGAFAALAGQPAAVQREVPLGASRMDFKVDDGLYLEVKTPLVQMQAEVPAYVPRLPEAPFSSTERSLRHLRELAQALQASAEGPKAAGDGATRAERAVVLYCLYYDNFGFRFYHGTTYEEVRTTVDACRAAGVELWQADFEVSPEGVALKGYWPLEEW